jgi:hypothetical protein
MWRSDTIDMTHAMRSGKWNIPSSRDRDGLVKCPAILRYLQEFITLSFAKAYSQSA